jgi:hypothetical protein
VKVQNRYLPEHDFKSPVYPEPGQGDYDWQEEPQEVSNLASFVAICLFIGMIAIVADALCHMGELPV